MRNSLKELNKLAQPQGVSNESTNFLSQLEETGWLKHIQSLLTASVRLVEMMDRESTSVLIHCSDGWDRTAQIGASAQIMMDPYYRTLEGLGVLIEKEWITFGHKFRDRLGHGSSGKAPKECSPIFLQWIDAVWQIMRQFPTAFQYNESTLITVLDEAYSCRFGTFLDNNERERCHVRKRYVGRGPACSPTVVVYCCCPFVVDLLMYGLLLLVYGLLSCF